MANPRPTPYDQHDHVPSSSDLPSQAGQWGTAARPDANTVVQSCSCSWCSATRHNDPPIWRPTDTQNPWLPGDPTVPPANQILGAEDPMGIGAMVNTQPQIQFVAPQVYDTAGYAPLPEGARFPQAQANARLDQPHVTDARVTESLRRLAGRLVNNQESLVNVLRVEPGASGRFRVVIILEVADLF